MKRIYANLCGNWCCLNEDPDCVMGIHHQSPTIWYEENAEISASKNNSIVCSQNSDSYYDMDYINIHYYGKDYRINPIFIQIVTD